MKSKALFFVAFLFVQVLFAQNYHQIHSEAILVDTHNDILTTSVYKNIAIDQDLKGITHSDLNRWKQGGLDVQFFSVWCSGKQDEPFKFALREIDTLDAVAKRNPDKIVEVGNTKELQQVVDEHKIAALMGVEGGHMMEDDLNKLDIFYKRGARYMTLTWNNSTDWATSAYDETNTDTLMYTGLTDFGKQVVHHMNDLGMMVDVSHVGEQTFWDVINTSSKPIIASHSSVYNICPHYRNLKDDQIKAIAKNGGVIQINFYSGYIDSTYEKRKDAFLESHHTERDSLMEKGKSEWGIIQYLLKKYKDEAYAIRAPFSILIQHIEYVINLVGVDYVGLGSDFDGITAPPQQMDDVTSYPLITKALIEDGYSTKDINKILGGNLLRVLEANEN